MVLFVYSFVYLNLVIFFLGISQFKSDRKGPKQESASERERERGKEGRKEGRKKK